MKHRHAIAQRTILCILSFCFCAVVVPAHAKRRAPTSVPPVVMNEVEYAAPAEFMAFVVAADAHSHKELWRQRIYTVNIDPALERDVQDVFITSLLVKDGTLVIENERHELYVLDLATRHVSRHR